MRTYLVIKGRQIEQMVCCRQSVMQATDYANK